ncbi:MAG: hypothetical protein AAFO99_01455 [Bacteroidota bacterium]
MKRLASLKGVKALTRSEQKLIAGNGPTRGGGQECWEVFAAADCCSAAWYACGFGIYGGCVNGQCIL